MTYQAMEVGNACKETSQFTWRIGQIFLVTLYIEGPPDS